MKLNHLALKRFHLFHSMAASVVKGYLPSIMSIYLQYNIISASQLPDKR